MLMLFNEPDHLIGPKLCQLTSIWIENQINKIALDHYVPCGCNKNLPQLGVEGLGCLRLYGLYGYLVIGNNVITENTSNDMYAQRFRTKHSLLIFGV
jgi:hypothetical protein